MSTRRDLINAFSDLLTEMGEFATIRDSMTDYRTEADLPVAWITIPEHVIAPATIAINSTADLRGRILAKIRILVNNDPNEDSSVLEYLIEQVLSELIQNTTLDGVVRTLDPVYVQTDDGLLVTLAMAEIGVEVQI